MSFSPKAKFIRGEPVQVPNTPGSAVAAGDVVKVGNSVRVAHTDIAANVIGSLAAGGGEYKLVMATGTNTSAIADGETVYWDTSNNWAQSGTNANTVKFGQATTAAGTSAGTINALHIPQA